MHMVYIFAPHIVIVQIYETGWKLENAEVQCLMLKFLVTFFLRIIHDLQTI